MRKLIEFCSAFMEYIMRAYVFNFEQKRIEKLIFFFSFNFSSCVAYPYNQIIIFHFKIRVAEKLFN